MSIFSKKIVPYLPTVNKIAYAVLGKHIHQYDLKDDRVAIIAGVPMLTRKCNVCGESIQTVVR